MSALKPLFVDEMCERGNIRDVDVLMLRRQYYQDGLIGREEAENLFRINDACRVQDPSWATFFIEAISDYIIHDAEPEGYLVKSNAEWLIAGISRDGHVEQQTEIELLLSVLDKARWSPEILVVFALEQVKTAICDGSGPLRTNADPGDLGRVTETDTQMLRRILYAFGGDGNIAVTRREADVLFEINDITAEADNCAQWPELFVKAIASSIMAASGYSVPPRSEILRRDAWLASRGDLALGNMISKAFSGGFGGILGAYQEQSAEQRALAQLERQRLEIITNQEITSDEAGWLADRIGRDGKLTPNEKALLSCIKEANPRIAPQLQPLLDRLGAAA